MDEFYTRLAWSPDGRWLAAGKMGEPEIWDAETGERRGTVGNLWADDLAWAPDGRAVAAVNRAESIVVPITPGTGQPGPLLSGPGATSVDWSPQGDLLALGQEDGRILLVAPSRPKDVVKILEGHSVQISGLTFSPDGLGLASASPDGLLRCWEVSNGAARWAHSFVLGVGSCLRLAWSPDGGRLISVGNDGTIRLWHATTGRPLAEGHGHLEPLTGLALHPSGALAATGSSGSIRLWRLDPLESVARRRIGGKEDSNWRGIAFHPTRPLLAFPGEGDRCIEIWSFDLVRLLRRAPDPQAVRYSNARAVLLGDSGVGRTGLALVLTGQDWRPTESTHGRHVWRLERSEGPAGVRETYLWDLAGQPGYRLVHQLHLDEVALALLVFDPRSETDPFAGLRYWDRALRQAERRQPAGSPPVRRLLVQARSELGGTPVGAERVEALRQELGAEACFRTSAKESWQIAELRAAMAAAIDWEARPRVSSTTLIEAIHAFLRGRQSEGALLAGADELFRAFRAGWQGAAQGQDLRATFDTALGLLEGQGLLRRLSFGGHVLLQAELLDGYASALVNAARDEPDGLGAIPEEDAQQGRFQRPKDLHLADAAVERLLLVATVEDLLGHEVALREETEAGAQLIFPAQSTREHPDLPDPAGRCVAYRFQGAVPHIYATLAVRLARSGLFSGHELYRNAMVLTARTGGRCGLQVRPFDEGQGELVLFHQGEPSEDTQFYLDEYVRLHLLRRALPNSVERRPTFACPACGTTVPEAVVVRVQAQGRDWVRCQVCEDQRIPLSDPAERLREGLRPRITAMDQAADAARERDKAAQVIEGKRQSGAFDLFLCYNSRDRAAVEALAGSRDRRPAGRLRQEEGPHHHGAPPRPPRSGRAPSPAARPPSGGSPRSTRRRPPRPDLGPHRRAPRRPRHTRPPAVARPTPASPPGSPAVRGPWT
ncbi:MAG: hypothetical protein ABIO70_05980 [Pseudomonadota bacterium]